MTKVTALLLLTLLLSIIVYVVINITVFVSARVWRYGSQLFHHCFYCDLPLHVFFVYLVV